MSQRLRGEGYQKAKYMVSFGQARRRFLPVFRTKKTLLRELWISAMIYLYHFAENRFLDGCTI